MSNLRKDGELRWVPSYLRRRGKVTKSQKRALRDYWPQFGLTMEHGESLPFESSFKESQPYALEIGFGTGEHLVEQAGKHPELNFLGVEVHKPGIGAALNLIVDAEISNVRVMRGDARLVLEDFLPEVKFQRIWVLFPDPWPGDSNAHRRLVQPDLVELMGRRAAAGCLLTISTDVAEYANHVDQVMSEASKWQRVDMPDGPDRCRTRYEQRGMDEGRSIHDRFYTYRD
ncbi:MAG: tRNA (guanosine(46)-N7)-methyltransferase TrmB [Verrucomicrobiota bacterium]